MRFRLPPLRKRFIPKGIVALILVLFVVIPVFSQLTKAPPRSFSAVRLENTTHEEVTFRNETQDIDLAGLLFIPEGEGPFPAAVIIHGSGTSIRANGWYLTLVQYLQQNGIAVLLPDKRGSEQSGGDWRTSSLEDLATDSVAAVSFLKSQNDIPVSELGIVGMSEGGRIAPIVENGSQDVRFLVNVVGGTVPSHETLRYEENHNLREIGLIPGVSNATAYASSYLLINVWDRRFWDAVGNFDPLPFWRKVDVRALTLYGEEDTNVPSSSSADRLRSLNKPNLDVRIFEGSGHALEDPPGTGDSIFREDALRAIRDFILEGQS